MEETVYDFKPQIDLYDDDFGAVLNCAIRYCIGRQSYMPSLVVGYIKPLLPYLNRRTIYTMWNDIRSADSCGDPVIDEPMWMNFLQDLVEELDKRDGEYENTPSRNERAIGE